MVKLRTILRRLGIASLVVLAGIQFFRPKLDNRGAPEGPESLAATLNPPARVRRYLENSCYDCHSEATHYPWYAHVQPIGWVIASHVREGKQSLNLSTFGALGKKAQENRLGYMADAIADREMPFWPYQLLNPHTKSSQGEAAAVTGWLNQTLAALETRPKPTDLALR